MVAETAAMVAASSAAAATTFGNVLSPVVGPGGSPSSIFDHMLLNALRPIRALINETMMARGL